MNYLRPVFYQQFEKKSWTENGYGNFFYRNGI